MKVTFLNLKNLYKENLPFALMIFLTVFMGAFAICFSVGLLHNNKYKSKEEFTSKIVTITLEKNPLYEENSEVVRDVMEIFGDALYEGTIDQQSNGATFYSQFLLTDNGYVPGPSVTEDALPYQVRTGRNFTEDDYINANAVAITVAGSTSDGLKAVTFGEKTYEVVGVRQFPGSMNSNLIIIPITVWGNNPINSISLNLTRIPFESEMEELTNLLDEHFPDAYSVYDRLAEVNSDTRALYKTIGMVAAGIIIVVAVTMLFLMGYIYEKRSYNMSVYRLLGLKSGRAISYFLAESAILLFIPALLGTVFFEIIRRFVLDRYYVYMIEIISIKFYMSVVLSLTVILMVILFAISCRLMFMSVKKGITEVVK